jgi:hypothetical protein
MVCFTIQLFVLSDPFYLDGQQQRVPGPPDQADKSHLENTALDLGHDQHTESTASNPAEYQSAPETSPNVTDQHVPSEQQHTDVILSPSTTEQIDAVSFHYAEPNAEAVASHSGDDELRGEVTLTRPLNEFNEREEITDYTPADPKHTQMMSDHWRQKLEEARTSQMQFIAAETTTDDD